MGQQSFTPEEILAASFAYTRSTVEGAGAIKGKNCQIQSIDPITGGVRITFVWYLDDGTEQTDTADVMNGADGKGIKSVAIDADEHLIITYTDNTTSDAGKIEVKSAVTSVNGKKGDVQLKTSDITNDSDYVSDANYVHTDNNYDNTAKGIVDGVTAELAKKVDKVTGKDLSTNDYTNADKAIVDNVTTNLAGKVDKVTGKDLSTNDYTNADKAIVDGVTAALANKVDKISGKDLSTNDYTNADKAIVDGVTAELANKADTTDVVDSASYDSTNHTILFKHDDTTLFSLNAAAFVKDGMIDTVEVTGGNLVITFNTDAGKQDISIPISDIFDANNYYNKTAIDNLLRTKQDTLTFDNTPTAGSNNPVKSGGIHSELSNKVNTSDIVNNLTTEVEGKVLDARQGKQLDSSIQTLTNQVKDMNNVLGAKNLVPLSAETQTKDGVTITVQDDGSIVLNGTATAYVYFKLTNSGIPLESGKCILSGVSGGSQSTYLLFTATSEGATLYQEIDGQRTAIRSVNGDSAIFDINKMNTTAGSSYVDPSEINIMLGITIGYTCDNVLIKPMIRLASIADDTYEPYAKTNKELTEDTNSLKETLTQQINELGAKNIFPFDINVIKAKNVANSSWSGNVCTKFGATFTVNDNNIVVGGTQTGSPVTFSILANSYLDLVDGEQYVVGGASGSNTGELFIVVVDGATVAELYGNITYTFTYDSTKTYSFYIKLRNSTSASHSFTVKPFLVPKVIYDFDPTYAPPAKTNQQLTKETTGLLDNQNVNGAVNMLPNNATTQVVNGVTFTVNSDGTVTANGTATADAQFNFSIEKYGVDGEFILSGCPSGGSFTTYWLSFWNKTDNTYTNDLGNGANVAISSNKEYRPSITIKSGQTVNNLVFKPMITVPSYTGPYVPYAKSNKELTEIVDPLKTQFDADHNIVKTVFPIMNVYFTDDVTPADWSNLTTQQATDIAQGLYDVFKKIGGTGAIRYTGILQVSYRKASDGSELSSGRDMVDILSNTSYENMLADNNRARFTLARQPYGSTERITYSLWGRNFMMSSHGINNAGTVFDFDKKYTYNTISTYKG